MRVEQINELADFHVSGRPDFEITGIAYAAGAEKRKLLSRKMSANYEKQKHRLFLCVLSL